MTRSLKCASEWRSYMVYRVRSQALARSGASQLVPSSRHRQGPPVALGPGAAPGASSPPQPARCRREDSVAASGVPPRGIEGGTAPRWPLPRIRKAWPQRVGWLWSAKPTRPPTLGNLGRQHLHTRTLRSPLQSGLQVAVLLLEQAVVPLKDGLLDPGDLAAGRVDRLERAGCHGPVSGGSSEHGSGSVRLGTMATTSRDRHRSFRAFHRHRCAVAATERGTTPVRIISARPAAKHETPCKAGKAQLKHRSLRNNIWAYGKNITFDWPLPWRGSIV